MSISPALPAGKKRDAAMSHKSPLLGLSLILVLGVSAGSLLEARQSPALPPQQGIAPGNQNPPSIVVRTENVVVPVTVKDGRGNLVGDLQRDEFRIFSDDVEQKITSFRNEAVPLSAVVLIDNDLTDKAVKQVQKSLTTISAGFGPADEVALVTYDQYPTTLADFSSNNDLLFTQLKRLELGSHTVGVSTDSTTPFSGPSVNGRPLPNGTGLPAHGSKRSSPANSMNDAIFEGGAMLKARSNDRRKIIFLISDGSNSRNVHTFDETLRSLLIADVSVYSISVTRSLPVGKALVQRGASDLDRYAARTGGDTFFSSSQSDLERLYSNVTEQARNEYTLTFSPQGSDRSHDFHTIEVRVRRAGLTINTRDGYYQSAIGVGR